MEKNKRVNEDKTVNTEFDILRLEKNHFPFYRADPHGINYKVSDPSIWK